MKSCILACLSVLLIVVIGAASAANAASPSRYVVTMSTPAAKMSLGNTLKVTGTVKGAGATKVTLYQLSGTRWVAWSSAGLVRGRYTVYFKPVSAGGHVIRVVTPATKTHKAGGGPSKTIRVVSPQSGLPAAYYGNWRVHGGGLTINRDGTAVGQNHVGNTASFEFIYEVDHYRIAPSSDGTYAVLTTTDVFWGVYLGNGQWQRVTNPDPSVIITVVGDRFSLRLLRPQLLKTTPFPGNHWNGDGGNPYLCGPQITAPDVALCGA
jgi:hypothetical protein